MNGGDSGHARPFTGRAGERHYHHRGPFCHGPPGDSVVAARIAIIWAVYCRRRREILAFAVERAGCANARKVLAANSVLRCVRLR